jgi:hypothetical protein
MGFQIFPASEVLQDAINNIGHDDQPVHKKYGQSMFNIILKKIENRF